MTALVAAGALVAACNGSHPQSGPSPATTPAPQPGSVDSTASMTVALGPAPAQWNPLVTGSAGVAGATTLGTAGDAAVVAAGVLPSAFVEQPDLGFTLNRSLLRSAKLVSTSPPTVVYRINPRSVWSDGVPITWKDFAYNWQAQSGLPQYRDLGGRPFQPASTLGYRDITSVAPTGGNPEVVTVTFSTLFADWQSLFSDLVPAHVATRVGFDGGFTDPVDDLVSGGPFVVEQYQPGVSMTLVRNPRWWGTPSSLATLTFDFVTTPKVAATAMGQNDVAVVYMADTTALAGDLKSVGSGKVDTAAGAVWEELELNQANPWLKDLAVRQAILDAVDRPALISAAVGAEDPGLAPLNNRVLVSQQLGYQDNSGGRYDHADVSAALQALQKAGFTMSGGVLSRGGQPLTLRLSATPDPLHDAEEAYLIKALSQIGITVTTEPAAADPAKPASYDLAIVDRPATPALAAADSEVGDPATVGTANYSHADYPEVDRLLAEADAQTAATARLRLYNRIDAYLWGQAESLPLFQLPTAVAYAGGDTAISATAATAGPAWDLPGWGVPYRS